MDWRFNCRNCGKPTFIDWNNKEGIYSCPYSGCNYAGKTPLPSEQHTGHVDTHNWPVVMEEVVVELKGDVCTVPNCKEKYETLDHRVPYSQGGKTSVENLFPMCEDHNLSKGDSNYTDWLEELDKE